MFKNTLPIDDEIVCREYDSAEIKKMKNRIEEHKRVGKNAKKNITMNEEKFIFFMKENHEMDQKIAYLMELIESKE